MAAESRSISVLGLSDDVWHLILPRITLRDAGQLAAASKDFHALISRLASRLLQAITRNPYIQESETPWLNRFVDVADRGYRAFGERPQYLKIIYRIFQAVKNPRVITIRGSGFKVTPKAILSNYQTFLDYLAHYRGSVSFAIPLDPLVVHNAAPGGLLGLRKNN